MYASCGIDALLIPKFCALGVQLLLPMALLALIVRESSRLCCCVFLHCMPALLAAGWMSGGSAWRPQW